MAKENILIINCGSSSLKFAVINPGNGDEIISGIAERLGEKESFIRWKFEGNKESETLDGGAHDAAVGALLHMLEAKGLKDDIIAVGHRVVHGGETFKKSCLVTKEVIDGVAACEHLAPLHTPANLIGIKASQKHFPNLPMAVVFDTSFHQTMPAKAYTYAVPYKFYRDNGLRRYGAHGTSYRFVSQRVCEMLDMDINNSKILVAHLGNGASAAAILNGQSVDTTMGLTPLEGLVMGTRSGNIDPNVFAFLNKEYGYSIEEITDILNKQSGLLGLSELSNDCRAIEEACLAGNEKAQLAMDVFCYVLAKQLAGLAVATGGVDALAFTGGIGENSDVIRGKVVEMLNFIGFDLDSQKNLDCRFGNEGVITTDTSRATALVVATNEELMIAQDTAALIG